MKAVRGNIRSGGEAATENEGGSMRNIYKKAASLLLVTMILLSMVVTGAVAEAAALNFADNTDARMETFREILMGTATTDEWLGYNRFVDSNVRRTTEF